MDLYEFNIFGYSAIIVWIIGIVISQFLKSEKILKLSAGLGIAIIGIFITIYWIYLQRPPLRTLAETRLWYSFILSIIGLFIYLKWKYNWFLWFTLAFSSLFILINIYNPETYNKSLMPALQSVWFIPHVIVYMIAYAFLAASFVVSVKGLFTKGNLKNIISLADNIVYIGFGFLTLGLLFGALWAKKAWGHYWTWDPKETWAFITWVAYLIYIHYRHINNEYKKTHLTILFISFILLMICWFGVQYLPSAQNSVHTYAY